MQTQLYPAEIMEHTTEAYLPQVSVQGQIIYVSVVLAVLTGLLSLPFIRIDVSVRSSGIIRSKAERNELRSLTGGTIAKVLAHENQTVKAGQPVFQLQTAIPDSKLRLLHAQQTEKQLYIRDLTLLVSSHGTNRPIAGLKSSLYRQQYEQYIFQQAELAQTERKRKRELEINQNLFAEKVIARQELEDKEFAFNTAQAQYRSFIERQVSDWENALSQYRMALDELRSQEQQLVKEKELLTITAPVAGTMGQLAGKYTGSYVQPGEILGVISPDSNLIVECYISPKDIGLLRNGMKSRMQVDAYDYNQWGMAEGTIISISNDVTVSDQQTFFKVKCRLNKDHLTLRQGVRGYLKKGMTLRAHFIITERSLYDLLYDKADDWLNPKNTPSVPHAVAAM
ncbi:HlyD family secretion protein [Dyadobacter sediminis]|uniref:HlyD family efflux transporter periplasmic adaptor subunit n=1 Tax=Dyadobacter sediminis TaxID=1493691 RepID=A0A5R9KJR4_9BACT|nr:HlyD family efflux transporter periplasmic adaptor subunit [Dyadobacter sediminis]TLU96442.1 HlyD family efflux transporter periplasmic adaptor subunit [Dyadobacter sediminis]GGB82260.1 HlyD family type I secretion periplasmic adaptor subunit [Dyadobacter sediminis]